MVELGATDPDNGERVCTLAATNPDAIMTYTTSHNMAVARGRRPPVFPKDCCMVGPGARAQIVDKRGWDRDGHHCTLYKVKVLDGILEGKTVWVTEHGLELLGRN
jgi:hypothetical protein